MTRRNLVGAAAAALLGGAAAASCRPVTAALAQEKGAAPPPPPPPPSGDPGSPGAAARTPRRDGSLVTLWHPVPALTGDASLWINADKPVPFEKGRVYVVHYWTFGCINCVRNLPHYQSWHRKFGDRITMIGVHTPETKAEKELDNVRKAVKQRGIAYPVLFDPKSENWNRWQQQWWPTVYLIDRQGLVRYYWMGELEWQGAGGEAKMRGFLEKLLAEPAPDGPGVPRKAA